MKISTKGRYALRMMLDLAMHPEGFVALKDIAERQSISKKYLEQIVPMLNKAELLRTNRGYQGGYMLAKKPSEYTVGEILQVTEARSARGHVCNMRSKRLPHGGYLYDAARVERAVPHHPRLPVQHHLTGYH